MYRTIRKEDFLIIQFKTEEIKDRIRKGQVWTIEQFTYARDFVWPEVNTIDLTDTNCPKT